MIVTNVCEKAQDVNVGLLSRNLTWRNEQKYEGSQDIRCPRRDPKCQPPKYRLESLLLLQICLVRQFNSCSLQINSLFHTKNLLLDFDDTVYTTQYDKFISEVVNFSLHCSRSIFSASPIESRHVFFTIFIMLCVRCPKPPVCYLKLSSSFIHLSIPPKSPFTQLLARYSQL